MFRKNFTLIQCPVGAGSGSGSGGSKDTAPAPAWVPYDRAQHGAEKVFLVRAEDFPETRAVLTQHGQLVTADKRRLIEWKPTEQAALPEAG